MYNAKAFHKLVTPTLRLAGTFYLVAAALLSQHAVASCTYSIDNEWPTGYTASIILKNDTSVPVDNWAVNWQYTTNRISSSWNANIAGANPYTATNLSWNAAILPGQTASFGLQIEKNGGSAERPIIKGTLCDSLSSSRASSSLANISSSTAKSSAKSSTISSTQSSVQSSSSEDSGYQVPANNFAQNGDVENGLTNWGVTAGSVTRSTQEKYGGTASVLISGRTANWNGLTFTVGSLGNGNQYDVAVWVKLAAGSPDSVIYLTAKRQDDTDSSTYNEYTRVAIATATASEWRLLQGYYTQSGTAFQHFIIEAADANISYYADNFSIGGEAPSSSSSSSSNSSAATCDLKPPFKWTTGAPVLSPKNSSWASIKDPTIVKSNGSYHVYATTFYNGGWKSMYTSFTDFNNAQQSPQVAMEATRVGNTVAPQVFYFRPQNKWYLITQWGGSYATADDISNPANWSAKQKLLQGEPDGALDFWVICNDANCYLYFSRDDGVLYVSKTSVANFPKFSGYSKVMEDHRGNGSSFLFEASNVYKLDGLNKYLMMVEAYTSPGYGPRFFRSWTATSLDGPWTALADTETNPFAGNNNVEWTAGKWGNGISHGELVRSGYDEKLTVDPCNLAFLFQSESGTSSSYNTIPYKLGLLKLKQ